MITHNFVLSWTGHLVAADLVIKTLQRSLDLNTTTLESVKAVLTDPAVPSEFLGLEVRLVGWVIDAQGQHCFLWNSLYPQELFMGAPKYDGSGELWALALAGVTGLHHSSSPPDFDSHEATRGLLSVTSRLMESEMWGPSTKPLGFGFGYETLQLVHETRFEYVDALYIPLTFELDDQGHFLSREFGASFYKYKSHGSCSVMYIWHPNARKQEVHVITPPGHYSETVTEDLRQRMLNQTYSYPFESNYYCVSIRLKAPCFVTPPSLTAIFAKDETDFGGLSIDVSKKDAISLPFDRKWVEWIYENVKADMIKDGKI